VKRKQRRGRYCYLCGRHRPNEAFSGKGHARHLCKECARLPREERERIEVGGELWGYWFQSRISPKNLRRLEALESHTDTELRATAALVRAAGLAHPGRRGRLRHLRREHPERLERLVTLGLVEDWAPYAGPGEPFLEEGELWGEPWDLDGDKPSEENTDLNDIPF